MYRPLIFGIGLLIVTCSATTQTFAEFKCDPGEGAKCHCVGGENCKELEKSGMCGNNSLLCNSSNMSGYTCDCTAKAQGVNANSLKVKQPLKKSQ
jgi:hypothetical protein